MVAFPPGSQRARPYISPSRNRTSSSAGTTSSPSHLATTAAAASNVFASRRTPASPAPSHMHRSESALPRKKQPLRRACHGTPVPCRRVSVARRRSCSLSCAGAGGAGARCTQAGGQELVCGGAEGPRSQHAQQVFARPGVAAVVPQQRLQLQHCLIKGPNRRRPLLVAKVQRIRHPCQHTQAIEMLGGPVC